jgi:DNA-binding transcriptional LysR family regulator
MELLQLRCLIAVSETLHFGRAAQSMDMLPASFGRHIRLLEESLDQRLLRRTTRSVSLTPEGKRFVEGARDIVELADRLKAGCRESNVGNIPTLRIGAIDSEGRTDAQVDIAVHHNDAHAHGDDPDGSRLLQQKQHVLPVHEGLVGERE